MGGGGVLMCIQPDYIVPTSTPVVYVAMSKRGVPSEAGKVLVVEVRGVTFTGCFFTQSSSYTFGVMCQITSPAPVVSPVTGVELCANDAEFGAMVPSIPTTYRVGGMSAVV